MADSNALVEKRDLFHAKQRDLGEVFELAKDGTQYDFSRAKALEKLGAADRFDAVAKIKERNRELDVLGAELQAAEMAEVKSAITQREEMLATPVRHAAHPSANGDAYKSFGELFTESKAYATWKGSRQRVPSTIEISLKTLFQTTAGFAPESVRSGLVVDYATRPIQVLDLIPSAPISQAAEKYMEETTHTVSGVEKAEGASYPESAYAYTERTSDVRKIADSIPVTDEQLEDELQVRSLLDQRLRFGLRQRMDSQVLVGNGTPPNLKGILNVAGIGSQAKGADPAFDAVYKAMTLVRFTGRAQPNALIFHPNDWQDIRLTRTADGQYIMGNPAQPGPMTLFGLPVALSDGITEGTGLAGDFANFCRIGERRGVEVQVGYVNTQFTDGMLTLRADLRACFTVYRPAAFAKITGL